MGFSLVSALELVKALRSGSFASLPARCAVLTTDDGSLGPFRSFRNPFIGQPVDPSR